MCRTTRPNPVAPKKLITIIKVPPPGPPPGLFPTAFTLLNDNSDPNSTLHQDFNFLKSNNRFKKLPFALIDYTSGSPVYLGNNDKKQFFVASMAKIGVLFAALWLRKTARENARKSTKTTIKEVIDELIAKWANEPKPFPDRFKKNFVASKTWPPNLHNILDGHKKSNGEWQLDFKSDHDFKVPNRTTSLNAINHFSKLPERTAAQKKAKRDKIDPLGFRDRLELMIAWSDNMAAASCIDSLGYQFINGSLEKAGFYNRDKTAGGGLWISLNYHGAAEGSDFQQTTGQGATAQVAATAMWLAATKKLIDREASEDWLMMMDKQRMTNQPAPRIPIFTTSLAGEELYNKQNLNILKMQSKIGIFYKTKKVNNQDVDYDFHYSDVVNIEQDDVGLVKYVFAICFSGLTDRPARVLKDLAFEMATIISSEHL
jgi:hypothetical protein